MALSAPSYNCNYGPGLWCCQSKHLLPFRHSHLAWKQAPCPISFTNWVSGWLLNPWYSCGFGENKYRVLKFGTDGCSSGTRERIRRRRANSSISKLLHDVGILNTPRILIERPFRTKWIRLSFSTVYLLSVITVSRSSSCSAQSRSIVVFNIIYYLPIGC